jgi:hypothetical protein
MTKLANLSKCAKLALDKVVCQGVAAAALDLYAALVDYLRMALCFDVSVLFQIIAVLAIICWIQNWLIEIYYFIVKLPKILKNIFCGKFDLCILEDHSDHDDHEDDHDDDHRD